MDSQVQAFRITGACAATFQVFSAAGELDLESITIHAEALAMQKVKYVFICGTTGKGVILSVEERKTVAEAWMKASKGRFAVTVHAGSESPRDVQAIVEHAAKIGVAAIAVMPPTFFKPEGGLDSVLSYLTWVCSLSTLPCYYYHIPSRTGVSIRVDSLLEKASAAVDGAAAKGERHALASFRGIKFSDSDLHIVSRCIQHGLSDAAGLAPSGLPSAPGAAPPRYDILFGSDEQLIGAAAMGVKGAVGSTYNYVGTAGNDILDSVAHGDIASAVLAQRRIQAVVHLLVDAKAFGPLANPMAVQKVLLEERLKACGLKHAECGSPRNAWNGSVTEVGKAAIVARLESIGYAQW